MEDLIPYIVFGLIFGFISIVKAFTSSDSASSGSGGLAEELENVVQEAKSEGSSLSSSSDQDSFSSSSTADSFSSDSDDGLSSTSSSDQDIPTAQPVSDASGGNQNDDFQSFDDYREDVQDSSANQKQEDRSLTSEDTTESLGEQDPESQDAVPDLPDQTFRDQPASSQSDTQTKKLGRLIGKDQRHTLRKAVLWKEIIQKPIALRSDHLRSDQGEIDI